MQRKKQESNCTLYLRTCTSHTVQILHSKNPSKNSTYFALLFLMIWRSVGCLVCMLHALTRQPILYPIGSALFSNGLAKPTSTGILAPVTRELRAYISAMQR